MKKKSMVIVYLDGVFLRRIQVTAEESDIENEIRKRLKKRIPNEFEVSIFRITSTIFSVDICQRFD